MLIVTMQKTVSGWSVTIDDTSGVAHLHQFADQRHALAYATAVYSDAMARISTRAAAGHGRRSNPQ